MTARRVAAAVIVIVAIGLVLVTPILLADSALLESGSIAVRITALALVPFSIAIALLLLASALARPVVPDGEQSWPARPRRALRSRVRDGR